MKICLRKSALLFGSALSVLMTACGDDETINIPDAEDVAAFVMPDPAPDPSPAVDVTAMLSSLTLPGTVAGQAITDLTDGMIMVAEGETISFDLDLSGLPDDLENVSITIDQAPAAAEGDGGAVNFTNVVTGVLQAAGEPSIFLDRGMGEAELVGSGFEIEAPNVDVDTNLEFTVTLSASTGDNMAETVIRTINVIVTDSNQSESYTLRGNIADAGAGVRVAVLEPTTDFLEELGEAGPFGVTDVILAETVTDMDGNYVLNVTPGTSPMPVHLVAANFAGATIDCPIPSGCSGFVDGMAAFGDEITIPSDSTQVLGATYLLPNTGEESNANVNMITNAHYRRSVFNCTDPESLVAEDLENSQTFLSNLLDINDQDPTIVANIDPAELAADLAAATPDPNVIAVFASQEEPIYYAALSRGLYEGAQDAADRLAQDVAANPNGARGFNRFQSNTLEWDGILNVPTSMFSANAIAVPLEDTNGNMARDEFFSQFEATIEEVFDTAEAEIDGIASDDADFDAVEDRISDQLALIDMSTQLSPGNDGTIVTNSGGGGVLIQVERADTQAPTSNSFFNRDAEGGPITFEIAWTDSNGFSVNPTLQCGTVGGVSVGNLTLNSTNFSADGTFVLQNYTYSGPNAVCTGDATDFDGNSSSDMFEIFAQGFPAVLQPFLPADTQGPMSSTLFDRAANNSPLTFEIVWTDDSAGFEFAPTLSCPFFPDALTLNSTIFFFNGTVPAVRQSYTFNTPNLAGSAECTAEAFDVIGNNGLGTFQIFFGGFPF